MFKLLNMMENHVYKLHNYKYLIQLTKKLLRVDQLQHHLNGKEHLMQEELLTELLQTETTLMNSISDLTNVKIEMHGGKLIYNKNKLLAELFITTEEIVVVIDQQEC